MYSTTLFTVATALASGANAQGLFGGLGLTPSSIGGLTALLPAGMLGGGTATMFTNSINSGYGRVADPAGAAPRKVNLAARFPKEIPGSKTIKVRYGPYKVPNMMKKNGFGEGGSLWNYADKNVEKPCDKCIIVGMNAGLEYPDGTNANIDTGAWLHHFVLFNQGPGRVDQTCQGKTSLPHANVGTDPNNSERMFSSGNERTPAFLTVWAGAGNAGMGEGGLKPVGYHMKSSDKLHMIVDLMNEASQDKVLYLTITYDYVDGHPAGYDDMRPVWFDVDQCGLSEVQPARQSGAFPVRAKTWYATISGDVLGYAGHLHDGGIRVTLDVDGKNVCKSEATYGGPGYVNGHDNMMENANSASEHISKMSICQGPNLAVKQMQKGQAWTLTADYDYSQHKGMLNEKGQQEDIMGIAIMYVRQPWSG